MASTHECSWRPDSRIPIATDLAVMGGFGHQLNVHWLFGGCTCQRPVRAAVNMHVSDLHHLSCRLAACQQSMLCNPRWPTLTAFKPITCPVIKPRNT